VLLEHTLLSGQSASLAQLLLDLSLHRLVTGQLAFDVQVAPP
jgi:hypothetical protein